MHEDDYMMWNMKIFVSRINDHEKAAAIKEALNNQDKTT